MSLNPIRSALVATVVDPELPTYAGQLRYEG